MFALLFIATYVASGWWTLEYRSAAGACQIMNPPIRKPRMLLRTAFTVLTVLFIVGYVTSGWFLLIVNANPIFFLGSGDLTSTWIDTPLHFKSIQFVMGKFSLTNDWFFGPESSPHRSTPIGYTIEFPLWPVVALLVLANALWFWRDWHDRSRPGFCPNCNYNLHGSPDRCPECGAKAEPVRR